MSDLVVWMDKLSATATNYAMKREYHPTAHLRYADGRVERENLTGAGGDHARDLRSLALIREPAMIALITESWTVAQGLTIDDPDVRRVVLNEIFPSQLPPHKRGEMLTMYAEAADGEHHNRGWYIHVDRRGRRTWLERSDPPEGSVVRFWPIFIVDDTLRRLERGDPDPDIPETFMSMLRNLGAELTAEQRRMHMRKALAQALLTGAGYSSRQFERETDKQTRVAAKFIAERGPAADAGPKE